MNSFVIETETIVNFSLLEKSRTLPVWRHHQTWKLYRLLIREPRTIRESSISATVSPVVSPLSNSSPRLLKFANSKSCALQSLMTCLSLASMSFSFTADIQMSLKIEKHSIIIFTAPSRHILIKTDCKLNLEYAFRQSLACHYKYWGQHE